MASVEVRSPSLRFGLKVAGDECLHLMASTAPVQTADDLLRIPKPQPTKHSRNFLTRVVCELRYPAVVALSQVRPPDKLVGALRKRFPVLQTVTETVLGAGAAPVSTYFHVMKTRREEWSAAFRLGAMALETSEYQSFEAFMEHLRAVVKAAAVVIDTDTFTRVGLRYINRIEPTGRTLDGWVNPALLGPVAQPTAFAGITEQQGRLAVQAGASGSGLLLQYGVESPVHLLPGGAPRYSIDIDSYESDVAVADVEEVLARIRARAYWVFDWALAAEARKARDS